MTSYPKDKIKILLLENLHPSAIETFKNAGYNNLEIVSGALSEDELIAKIKDVHVLGIRSKTNITATILQEANKLLAIGCFCIGTNQVDIKTATEAGVAVFNSPFSNTRSVAELVIGNMIFLMRRIAEKDKAAHKGEWLKDSKDCFVVRGKTLGIIGYGHIGSQVSVLAESLGLHVVFYDVESKLSLGNANSVKTLEQLLNKADIITLHVPGLASTKNIINTKTIAMMMKGAILINLSRGDVMDINAVKQGIESKQIGGLAVDVFPIEPEAKGDIFESPLQNLSNVILTPHIGGSTMEAQENIGIDAATKLINFIDSGSSAGSLSIPALNLPLQSNVHRLLHIHKNVPGVLSEINNIMSKYNINILAQYLQTNSSIGYVVLDIDVNSSVSVAEELKTVKSTIKTRSVI
jgi:D-3-phosphoglycerate dehydrogenase